MVVELDVVLPHHAADGVPPGVAGISVDTGDMAKLPFLPQWNNGNNGPHWIGSLGYNNQGRIGNWRHKSDMAGGLLVDGGTADGLVLVAVVAVLLVHSVLVAGACCSELKAFLFPRVVRQLFGPSSLGFA